MKYSILSGVLLSIAMNGMLSASEVKKVGGDELTDTEMLVALNVSSWPTQQLVNEDSNRLTDTEMLVALNVSSWPLEFRQQFVDEDSASAKKSDDKNTIPREEYNVRKFLDEFRESIKKEKK